MPPAIVPVIRFVGRAMGLVWPARCSGCGAFVDDGVAFCPACALAVVPIDQACPGCAMPVGEGGLCAGCARAPMPFARAMAPLTYGGPLAHAIQQLKHHGARPSSRPLGAYLSQGLATAFRAGIDMACPVPLHPRRLRKRGYNQALELLRAGMAQLPPDHRIPVVCDALRRLRDTPMMRHGSPSQRRLAVVGAFGVGRPALVRGRSVLLVDDVMTTGATLAECARTLRSQGALQVWALALARAI